MDIDLSKREYIKSLKVKNFGAWSNLDIDFHQGVNVIVGESGGGKSSLLKALDFVVNNNLPDSAAGPLGFITRPYEDGKIAEVELITSDYLVENKIKRVKGKSKNTYQLNNEQPQGNFKQGVPPKIAEIINMKPINYHRQEDDPFLLNDKPGDAAKKLAEVIDIQQSDNIVKFANSVLRNHNQKLKQAEEENKQAKEDLDKLKFVKEFEGMLDNLDDKQHELERLEQKFDKIDLLVFNIETQQKILNLYDKARILSNYTDNIDSLKQSLLAAKQRSRTLLNHIQILRNNKKVIVKDNKLKKLLSKINQLGIYKQQQKDLTDKINNLIQITNSYYDSEDKIEICKQTQNVSDYVLKLEQHKQQLIQKKQIISDLKNTTQKYHNSHNLLSESKITIEQLKKIIEGQTCPMCNQIIN